MNIEKTVVYWLDSSDADFRSMNRMYNAGEYSWALFVGHLTIEKLLKAIFVLRLKQDAPLLHDLVRLAEKANLELAEERKSHMRAITLFNISTRYPDDRNNFRNKCTREFAEININEIKGLRKWLKKYL